MHKMAINRRGNLTGKNNESHNLSEVTLFVGYRNNRFTSIHHTNPNYSK